MALGAECMVGRYRKNSKGSQIPKLRNFVRLLSTSKYLKKCFENYRKPHSKRKRWQMCFCRLLLYSIVLFYIIILFIALFDFIPQGSESLPYVLKIRNQVALLKQPVIW